MFKAILLSQSEDKKTRAELLDLDEARLPDRDVTVAVEYSTLNYKDALAITGRGAVVRKLAAGAGHRPRRHRHRQPQRRCGSLATRLSLPAGAWARTIGAASRSARALDAGWLLQASRRRSLPARR